jgi:hypothetical protein
MLQYDGTGRTMKCPYCGSDVQVPDELWQPAEEAQATSRWKKYIVIFLIVTVGVPTCASLVGVAAGLGGSILAVVLPFALRLFGH